VTLKLLTSHRIAYADGRIAKYTGCRKMTAIDACFQNLPISLLNYFGCIGQDEQCTSSNLFFSIRNLTLS